MDFRRLFAWFGGRGTPVPAKAGAAAAERRRRGKVDVWRRYEALHHSISGTMSSFYKVRDRETREILGLKILDPKKVAPIEGRYKGLGKPPSGGRCRHRLTLTGSIRTRFGGRGAISGSGPTGGS